MTQTAIIDAIRAHRTLTAYVLTPRGYVTEPCEPLTLTPDGVRGIVGRPGSKRLATLPYTTAFELSA